MNSSTDPISGEQLKRIDMALDYHKDKARLSLEDVAALRKFCNELRTQLQEALSKTPVENLARWWMEKAQALEAQLQERTRELEEAQRRLNENQRSGSDCQDTVSRANSLRLQDAVVEGEMAHAKEVTCLDCGENYENQPLDVVLTREQWLMIHPDDGGILCAKCIVERAAKLAHVINLTASITFASDYNSLPPLQELEEARRIIKSIADMFERRKLYLEGDGWAEIVENTLILREYRCNHAEAQRDNLLKALKLALSEGGNHHRDCYVYDFHSKPCNCWLTAARAAIAELGD